MYTKKSLHGIISVHFHQRRSEFGQKLTKFDPKSWNQKESVQESIQESKGIGFSSQHQPPEPKNPSPEGCFLNDILNKEVKSIFIKEVNSKNQYTGHP